MYWEHNVDRSRNSLANNGLIKRPAARDFWELSDLGKQQATNIAALRRSNKRNRT